MLKIILIAIVLGAIYLAFNPNMLFPKLEAIKQESYTLFQKEKTIQKFNNSQEAVKEESDKLLNGN